MSVEIVDFEQTIVALQQQLKMKDELLNEKDQEVAKLKNALIQFTNSINKIALNNLTMFNLIEESEMKPVKKTNKKVANETAEKPKRKTTKKAVVENAVTKEEETPVAVVVNDAPVAVVDEAPVVVDATAVQEKPKRKYTKKPKVEEAPAVEGETPVVEEKPKKAKAEKKPKAEKEPVVEGEEKPKKAKAEKKPKAEKEPAVEGEEKPKRKYNKKAKTEVPDEVVVPAEEHEMPTITEELSVDTYNQVDEDEGEELQVEEFEFEGKLYWKCAEDKLYDHDSYIPCGSYDANTKTAELYFA
jgi:hypothetical protein